MHLNMGALRDLDIIREMENGAVSISVAFSDNQSHRIFEANTQETARRTESLRKFKEAGVRTGVLLCPVVPYISDVPRIVEMLEPYADTIWVYGLSMPDCNGQNRKYIETILNNHYTELVEKIMPVMDSREDDYWIGLTEKLEILKGQRKLDIRIHL